MTVVPCHPERSEGSVWMGVEMLRCPRFIGGTAVGGVAAMAFVFSEPARRWKSKQRRGDDREQQCKEKHPETCHLLRKIGTYEMEAATHMNFLVPGFGDVPILTHKHYEALSTFTPENLLREARRQKGLPVGNVPTICVFDPDGALVENLHATGRAQRHPTWACYHTVSDHVVH